MHPLEWALKRTVLWLVPAVAACGLLLAVPQPGDPLGLFIGQLTVVVGFGVALAVQLSQVGGSGRWFVEAAWSRGTKRLAASSALVALDTGAVALLTLASSAALRLEPSLQFLQLLSALDVAWVTAAIVMGASLKWGPGAAWAGGGLVGVICVFSVWRYLDIVGFTADGGWLVSRSDLLRYVIPFDVVAAAMAVAVLAIGAQSGRPIEHARAQS